VDATFLRVGGKRGFGMMMRSSIANSVSGGEKTL
jgi:hypothetical protein